MPFGKVLSRIEVDNGTICDPYPQCHPGGCSTSGRGPQKGWPQAPIPVETPAAPIAKVLEDIQAPESEAPTLQEIEGPNEELTPAELSTEGAAPTEEPTEELAAAMARVSRPAEEPGIPPVWHKGREKGEVPWSNFPGWTEVLHPTQLVIPTGWTPRALSGLRQQYSSQSVGRRPQCWWAKGMQVGHAGVLIRCCHQGPPSPNQRSHCLQASRGLWHACSGIHHLHLPLRLPRKQGSQIHWWDPQWQWCMLPA